MNSFESLSCGLIDIDKEPAHRRISLNVKAGGFFLACCDNSIMEKLSLLLTHIPYAMRRAIFSPIVREVTISRIGHHSIRYHSTSPDFEKLKTELLSRRLNYIHDYITPTSSHLLNLSLSDHIPTPCQPPTFDPSSSSLPASAVFSNLSNKLPQSHHIVYFPPQHPQKLLLPDGTDADHSPGEPFTRRMWAGGSLHFARPSDASLTMSGRRAVCIEGVRDVTMVGSKEEEKVFVHIERQMGEVCDGSAQLAGVRPSRDQHFPDKMLDECVLDNDRLAIVERRTLVFMREHASKDVIERRSIKRMSIIFTLCRELRRECLLTIISAPSEPEFSFKTKPSATLLFRFSALTFNAHRIHLDRGYTKEAEGHRNLLVHGPLTLVLMISLLRGQLTPNQYISSFEYKNIAPLYADEELEVCGKEIQQVEEKRQAGELENMDVSVEDKCEIKRQARRKFKVWILGQDGGLAVRGSAEVHELEEPIPSQGDKRQEGK
jgi:hydroxyacyl-ACP dehydratase HTD2-like protein with hotdog domain